ncbi:T9SS type A sorting domain-containing protein [bacterium]|nr:T9SS type A sorting domain-containing protein [bacterium]
MRWNGSDSLQQFKPSNLPLMPGILCELVGTNEGEVYITGGYPFSTLNGLLRYDTTGTFIYYDSTNSSLATTDSASAYFYEPQRGVWITHGKTASGKFRLQFFDGTYWSTIDTTLLFGNATYGPRSLQISPQGEIWFTQGISFVRINPDGSLFIKWVPLPNGGWNSQMNYSMLVDNQNGIWGTKSSSDPNSTFPIVYWDQDTTWTYYYNADFGPTQVPLTTLPVVLGEDNAGNIWFGFIQNSLGLMKFDGNNFICCYDTLANGQAIMQSVQNAFKDSQNRLWITNTDGSNNYNAVILDALQNEVTDPRNQVLTKDYELFQNYPNPFNPKTTISFYVPFSSKKAVIRIFNVLGQEVKNWQLGDLEKGVYKINWHGEDQNYNKVSSGIYFYRLESENFSETKKMVLIK